MSKLIGGVGALLGGPLAVFYRYSKNYSQNYIWGASKQVIVCAPEQCTRIQGAPEQLGAL